LSDQQVKDVIDTERTTRTDLPAAFPKYEWSVRRQGCYYIYFEYGLPKAIHKEQIFKLNQNGAIVDVEGVADKSMKCPDEVITESALAEIIKRERAKGHGLPPAFPRFKTRVSRLRCLYLYFESALPETGEKYHTFIIDPFGELMEFFGAPPDATDKRRP
jgi:hypothetical protein